MWKRTIRSATVITLSQAERTQLETLWRGTKSEVRMRQRARILLLAAAGTATREISRQLRCTIGTVSKWRVPYVHDRFADLSEIGDRGAEQSMAPNSASVFWQCSTGHHLAATLTGRRYF